MGNIKRLFEKLKLMFSGDDTAVEVLDYTGSVEDKDKSDTDEKKGKGKGSASSSKVEGSQSPERKPPSDAEKKKEREEKQRLDDEKRKHQESVKINEAGKQSKIKREQELHRLREGRDTYDCEEPSPASSFGMDLESDAPEQVKPVKKPKARMNGPS